MRKYLFILCSLILSCDQGMQPEQTNTYYDCECSDPPTGVLVWEYPVKLLRAKSWYNKGRLQKDVKVSCCRI